MPPRPGSTLLIELVLRPLSLAWPPVLPSFGLGNTPLHLAMESAHAEAAIMLIEAGADRSRVRPVFLKRPPDLFVTNRVIVILDVGKPGQRDAGASCRRRRTRAEARQGLCCFALWPTNVTLARVRCSLHTYRHVMFVFPPISKAPS